MKLRVKVPFDFYSTGDIIEPTGCYRDWLCQQGYCEPVRDEGGEVEVAVAPGAEEHAVKRKRGRPRKKRD